MIVFEQVVLRREERLILDHIDLVVEDGETLVILGGSGAGKSTLLRLMMGLLRPQSGRILIDGADITQMDEAALNRVRRHMGMVFQYSALFDSLSVGENVAFGLRAHTDMSESQIQKIVHRTLRMVGLSGTAAYAPSALSGGMKKRVSLARAMALDPHIIAYDEPTSGLDPISSGTISRLIRSTQKHLGCTSVVVTHDMASAFSIADRIALLDGGRFIEISPTEQFRTSENLRVQQFIHGAKSVASMRRAMARKESPDASEYGN